MTRASDDEAIHHWTCGPCRNKSWADEVVRLSAYDALKQERDEYKAVLENVRSDLCWVIDRHDVPLLADMLKTVCAAIPDDDEATNG